MGEADRTIARIAEIRDHIACIERHVGAIYTVSGSIQHAPLLACDDLDKIADRLEAMVPVIREGAAYMRREHDVRAEAEARVDALVASVREAA